MEPEKGNRISVLRMKQQWIQRKQHNYSGAQNRAVEEFSETEDSSGTQNGDMVGLKKERFDSHNIVMVELEKEGGGTQTGAILENTKKTRLLKMRLQ